MASLKSLTNGLEMGKLGDFIFYMDKNEYKKISQTLTATNSTFIPTRGQEQVSFNGGFNRKISLNGILVLMPLDAIMLLEEYLINRKPIRFTPLFTDINVLITSLTITQEHFTDDGNYTVQTYNLSLKEVYDEVL